MTPIIFGISGSELLPMEKELFMKYQPYGYIIFKRNIVDKEQLKALSDDLRSVSNHDIKILIDQEGGRVARMRPPIWDEYPPAKSFGAMALQDLDAAKSALYENYAKIARDLVECGINVNCAPVCDIYYPFAHEVIGDRAFGSDVNLIVELSEIALKAMNDQNVDGIIKHIPGHGRAMADSHEELPVVNTPLDELMASDFKIFEKLKDTKFAMTAHVKYTHLDKDNPVTLSPNAISFIRKEIGFNGQIISDDLCMKALAGDVIFRAQKALQAGCDILLHCNGDYKEMELICQNIAPMI